MLSQRGEVQREPEEQRAPGSWTNRTKQAARVGLVGAGVGSAVILSTEGSAAWTLVRLLALGVVVSGATRSARGDHPWRATLATAAFGLIATAAGGAIGFRYLSFDGWSVRMVGALVTAVSGVVLLAVAVRSTVHLLAGWRRLLTVPAGLALLYGVGSPVAIAVTATNVPRSELGALTPGDRGFAYEDVKFTTADGVNLSGWYIPSPNGTAVALLHGASSNRSRVLDHAVVLASRGYGVLLYDARGQGRSGGRAMNLGWYGDLDITAAVDFLRSRPDVDPRRIGAVGLSMGGEQAIGALAADPRLRAVVAEGATNRVAADLSWLDDRYGIRGRIQQAVSSMTTGLTELLTDAPRPVKLRDAVAAAGGRPVLLIAAGDVADELYAGEEIRSISPRSVELWAVPGADHVGGLRVAPEDWEQRVAAFLEAALR